MRFLIFNIVVAAALVYLFTAEHREPQFDSGPARALAQDAEPATRDPGDTVDDPEAGTPPATAPQPDRLLSDIESELAGLKTLLGTGADTLPEPPTVPSDATLPEAPRGAAPEPAAKTDPVPSVQANQKLVESVNPDVAARRDVVLAETPDGVPQARPSAVRRQDLQRLIEEMELFAIEALAQ